MDTGAGICSLRRFQDTNPSRMTTPATPSAPKPAGDDRNLVVVDASTASSFEDKLHLFWKGNGTAVMTLIGLVIVGIIAKGGWDYLAAQKELDVEKAYAAATTPAARQAFIAAHPDHALAGIGQLALADEAYNAGKPADALAGYEKAATIIKTGPLAARAKLGRALAKIQSGKAADGVADLKQLAADTAQFKGIRVEANYQLASLASDANNGAEVQKYADALMAIDPASPWTQRALALRAMYPVAAPAAANGAAAPAAGLQVKLPAK